MEIGTWISDNKTWPPDKADPVFYHETYDLAWFMFKACIMAAQSLQANHKCSSRPFTSPRIKVYQDYNVGDDEKQASG